MIRFGSVLFKYVWKKRMRKKLFKLKMKLYAALIEGKNMKASKIRRKMLKQEVLISACGKSFKSHHIVT